MKLRKGGEKIGKEGAVGDTGKGKIVENGKKFWRRFRLKSCVLKVGATRSQGTMEGDPGITVVILERKD